MSSVEVIEKRICIDPAFLGQNFKKDVFNYIKNVCENECSKEYGYILKVLKINKIKDNNISGNNCEIILTVDILVETLKPEINKIFTDKVCMIFSGGIFLDIKNKFKVLIPATSLQEFTFKSETKSFVKDDLEIKENDSVSAKITGIKYNKKNFSCFAEISLI